MDKQKGLPRFTRVEAGLAPILIILLIALAVGGYFIYQKQNKSISISQPSPSPIIETSNSAETANWKTYINKDYKYEIKYPNDWTYKNIQYQSTGSGDTAPSFTGIGLLPIEPKPANDKYAAILIKVFDNPKKLSLEFLVKDWYGFSTKPGALADAVKKGEEVNINGIQGKKVVNPPIDTVGLPVTWVLVPYNDKVFLFVGTFDKSYPEINIEEVFNQILSTFKFTK